MNDFAIIMRAWKRLCDSMESYGYDACSHCPINQVIPSSGCVSIWDDDFGNYDWTAICDTIVEWFKEHPEKIYPTWKEWLSDVTGQMVDGDLLASNIPESIAEKYNIKEKRIWSL